MSEVMPSTADEVACGNCVGLCCRAGKKLPLTAAEAAAMNGPNENLVELHAPKWRGQRVAVVLKMFDLETGVITGDSRVAQYRLRAGYGLYELKNDCIFLVQEGNDSPHCANYEERANVCRRFDEGGDDCKRMRYFADRANEYPDWQPIELSQKPAISPVVQR